MCSGQDLGYAERLLLCDVPRAYCSYLWVEIFTEWKRICESNFVILALIGSGSCADRLGLLSFCYLFFLIFGGVS